MKFENEDLGAVLILPDKLTVGMVLDYDSRVELDGYQNEKFTRLWDGVRSIAESLECDYCTLEIDLKSAENLRAVEVIKWACIVTFSYLSTLKAVPKN